MKEMYCDAAVVACGAGGLAAVRRIVNPTFKHLECSAMSPYSAPAGIAPESPSAARSLEQEETAFLKRELASLYYGRLSIIVKQGTVTHFDRLEKQRFMDGDGI